MKKSVAYLRMSTDKQEYSIDSQLRLIKAYAERNGYWLMDTYIDEGISGRQAEKRPAFMQMIDDSSKGTFEYVLIYDSSRFARNLEQSIVYKSILKRNSVDLISITEPIVDEDTSLITDALLGAMNEMYSRKLSKVVKRGMEQKALGNEYFSCAPYGYKKPHKKPLEIIEAEANVVRLVYQKFMEDTSPFKIAQELNALNIKTKRGKCIDKRWVQKVLTNVTYKGYMLWKIEDRTYYKKANHPAIIDEDYFDKVQQKYSTNIKRIKHKGRPLEQHKHWLTGVLRCPACDTVYVYAKSYSNRADRFRCGGYVGGRCSISKSYRIPDLEALIINELYSIANDEGRFYNLHFTRITTTTNTDLINKEINQLKKTLKRAKDAYLSEIDTLEEYKENKEKLQGQIDELKKKLSHSNKLPTHKELAKNINSVLEVLESDKEMLAKIKAVKSLIEKITLNGLTGEMLIYFYA